MSCNSAATAPRPGTVVTTTNGWTARVGLYQTEFFKGWFPVIMLDGPERGISQILVLTDLRGDYGIPRQIGPAWRRDQPTA